MLLSPPLDGVIETLLPPPVRIPQRENVFSAGMFPRVSHSLGRLSGVAASERSWENRSGEPVVFVDGKLSELTVLAAAITKHVPKDAVILAWWDTSRQIRLLTGYQTVFNSHLRQPLLMPSLWRARSEAIEKYEREFWRARISAKRRRFFASC